MVAAELPTGSDCRMLVLFMIVDIVTTFMYHFFPSSSCPTATKKIHLRGSVEKKVVLATAYDMSAHCRKALASHPEACLFKSNDQNQ